MKKTIALFLTLILIVSTLCMSAYATDKEINNIQYNTPRYTYLANCWAGLTPTGGGWYDVSGGAGSARTDVEITVTVILQRFSYYGWVDIATWTNTNQFSASCGASRYIATPGEYRTHVIVDVYKTDGTYGESETVNSDHIIIS